MTDTTPGNAKAAAAGISGALVIILSWIVATFVHIDIPIEVAAAFQTVFTTLAVYMTPHSIGGN